ncbi:MAG TPA: MauE/DoxX family redox-associated membrane protein [Steroidobacteraceae bacterium]|nr:MauE/DoxX family redox-associated membrane protein [Steroidobacteraceae bacterium]
MISLAVDPAVAALAVTCLALLFAAAALHKLRDLRVFAEIFAAYEILPGLVRLHLTALVPALEAGVAAGLLLKSTRPAAAVLAVTLLLGYAASIGINLRRGRRDLACGCGGPNERRPIAPWMIARNLLLAALAGLVLFPLTARSLELTDAVTISFGTLTCALIYLCLDTLLGRSGLQSAELRQT